MLHNVEFVIYTGRPGHEGLFRIQGQPLVGEPQTLLVQLLGSYATAEFRFVSREGDTLAVLDLKQGDPRAAADDFVGQVELPDQPFEVMVFGTTLNGEPYQRVFPALFTPQPVGVSFARVDAPFRSGQTTPIAVEIRNVGPPATFQVRVTLVGSDTVVSNIKPSEVTLERGERKTVELALDVPPNIKPGAEITVIVTATDVANSSVSNGAILTVEAK